MIRQSNRLRLVLSLLLVVFGLLASYALLRGASGITTAAPKTASATTPNAAPASAGISQSPAPERSVPERPIAKPRVRKGQGVPKQPSVKLVPVRTSDSDINASTDAAVVTAHLIAPKDTLLALGPTDPISLNKVVPSKLRALPLPQGGSGSPPNPPTLSSPANGGTGVSTSPTLKVNVSDPNSNNVTVNFYGKVIPSVTAGPSFTIVALPDTQYYSSSQDGGSMAMFNSQTQWAVDNVATSNIALVIGLGDIVQDGNLNGNFFEWANADSAVSLLDNPSTTGLPQGIPYSFGVGNHDQGPNGNGGQPNDTAGYNQYFGISRYSGKSYYGGHYGTQNDNHYELFSAGGMDFIVINLAYDVSADPNVLAWANGLLQTYSNRRGILVSHYLINDGFNATWSPQGQATYNALRGNPNLFLMLAGHWTPPEGQRTDVFNGNRVFTLMSDYQDSGGGGDGWMRILTFSPANNQIQVQTYSPFLDQSETTSSGQFTINYDMQGNGNNFALLASKTGVLSGTSTSFTWSGLSAGSSYEWYATVSNSTGTAVGPLWSFATSGSSPVTLSPSSLTFPGQPVNTTSGSQSVTLTNTGSAALSISNIAASTQFAQTNSCPISPSTLPVNGTCSINVTFTPTATGTQSGSITISDNASGSPQVISLSGSGTSSLAPAVSLSPSSLTFGSSAITVVQDTSTTGSGSSTLTATFASKVTQNNLMVVGISSYSGNTFASPAITDSLGSTWTLAIARNPGTAGSPSQANLYYAVVPSTGTDTLTVHATGTNNLHLHIYEVSGLLTSSVLDQTGSNYQPSATAATVSTSGPTTTLNEYVFAYFGRDNGSGTWTTGTGYTDTRSSPNAGSAADAFSEDKTISATGTQTAMATSSATDALTSLIATFKGGGGGGGIMVGTTSAAQVVTLTNTGSASLSISSIAASGDYAQTNTCGSFVGIGANCTISVTFTPTATGSRPGTITITDNAGNSPQTVSLTGTGIPAVGPAVTLAPTSLSFGNQTVNTPSATQPVTLTNSGTTTLNISNIAASAQYSQTNTCGASVTAGANCTITVTFTPTATGSQPGTITITDNATGSPHIVNLSGTGTNAPAPAVTLAPTSLSFGNQTLNTPSGTQPVTLTNSGTATLNITNIVASAQYSQTNTCGASVTAGANCTITVTFTPTATGSQPGTITITDNATGSPHIVNLSGTGTNAPAPAVTLAPTSLSFGNQTLNTPSGTQPVTLTNSGTATLNITNIVASAQYSQTNTCGASVTAGANCTITVTFTPTATGSQPGTITITDNAPGSPHIVNLSGTGTNALVPAVTLAPTSLSFGNQAVNTPSATQPVTLTNSGTATLNISNIAASAPYSQTNACGASVAAGAKCTITVTFTPTAAGSQPGTITVTDNAAGSPQTIPLTGTGVASGVNFSPASLSFGNQNLNTTSAAQPITMTNGGASAVSITSIAASAPYAQTNTCGSSLAAGGNCTISVTFTPTVAGSQPGTITFTDSDPGSPQTLGLSGTGTTPGTTTASLSPTTLAFGIQQINTTSSSKTVRLTNTGTVALTLTSIVPSVNFTETNNCAASINPGSRCTITVKFSPTTPGALTGTITITDNATGSPQVVPLTGNGADITLSPTSLPFGTQAVGTISAAQTVTLTNAGTVALTITRIATSGQYAQTNTCVSPIAGGASCTISVTFNPTTTGTHNNTLTITDNATGSPKTVSLTGTGQ